MSLVRRFLSAFVLVILAYALFLPHAEAIYTDSNVQCPPGGKIGASCVDNTNGYQTQGTCAYIYVCKATNVNGGSPPICAGGSCPVGGPPPSNFNPYPKPVKVASGSPEITKSDLSVLEQGILDGVFSGNSSTIDPNVDLAAVSAEANARLQSLSGLKGEEDLLLYVPESFDSKTSALFAALRDQAVSLAPGGQVRVQGDAGGSARLAYPGGGFFGGDFSAPVGGSGEIAINTRSFIDAPQLFARAFANMINALLNIVLADFATAGQAWADAKVDFSLSFMHFGAAISSLFAFLWELLKTWLALFSK